MSYQVLLAVDVSEQSREALDYVAARHADDDVTALHVIAPAEIAAYSTPERGGPVGLPDLQEQQREQAEQLLESISEQAVEQGLDIETDLEVGQVEQEITSYTEEHAIDHVVIGSHGRTGASRILLGSVAETVARRSPVPVTIVR